MHDLLFVLWYLCKRTMSGNHEAEDVKKGLQMTILEIISSMKNIQKNNLVILILYDQVYE